MTEPLDHTRFLASLSPETRAEMTRTEDRAGLIHLAGHLAMITVLSLWVGLGWPLWQVALLPLGIGLNALFMLEHECTHQTPFKSRWLNEAAGHGAGFIIGIPFHWFRAFHMAHHRHTNDPNKDPELKSPKPKTTGELIWLLTGVTYWRDKFKTLFRLAFGQLDDPFLTARQRPRIRREARINLGLYAALILTTPVLGATLFWIWVLPLILGAPFLRAYLLSEHDRCPMVPDMFDNSRTTLTNRAVRFLAWNMPYHAEHHAWPQVPFHRLKKLHALTKPHLKHVSPGYGDYISTLARESAAYRMSPATK